MKTSIMYLGTPYYVNRAFDLLHDLSVDGFRVSLTAAADGTAECGVCKVESGAMYQSGAQPSAWEALQAAVRAIEAARVGL